MFLEMFDLSTWLILLLTLGLAVLMLNSRGTRHKNLPPGPSGLPIFGNIFMINRDPQDIARLASMAKEYGKVMTIRLGSDLAFVLSGYDVMKEALVDKAEYFSERPRWLPLLNRHDRNAGIFFNPEWRERRRFALVSMRDFGLGKKSLDERIREEAAFLIQEIDSKNGKPVDFSSLLPYTTANIICAIINGKRYDYGDEEAMKLVTFISSVARSPSDAVLLNFVPFFRIFKAQQDKLVERVTDNVFKILKKWRVEHEETFDADNIRDLTDLFIKEMRKGSRFQEADLLNCVGELFIAGTETTSTTLSWILLYLVHHPEVQQRCREEIHREIGKSTPPQYSDAKQTPYVNAVINEVQRVGNILPFSLWHATNADVQLAGYTLPKNTIVLMNLYTALRDENYWSEPHKFNPDRWLDSDGNLVKNPAFIPFSTGRRVCLGEQLAKKELFLFLTSMLQNFEFQVEDKESLPNLDGVAGVVHGPGSVKLKALRV